MLHISTHHININEGRLSSSIPHRHNSISPHTKAGVRLNLTDKEQCKGFLLNRKFRSGGLIVEFDLMHAIIHDLENKFRQTFEWAISNFNGVATRSVILEKTVDHKILELLLYKDGSLMDTSDFAIFKSFETNTTHEKV